MESFKELKKRHDKEIDNLQNSCPHEKISDWINSCWAPGHYGLPVKYCLFCEKTIERKKPEIDYFSIGGG